MVREWNVLIQPNMIISRFKYDAWVTNMIFCAAKKFIHIRSTELVEVN